MISENLDAVSLVKDPYYGLTSSLLFEDNVDLKHEYCENLVNIIDANKLQCSQVQEYSTCLTLIKTRENKDEPIWPFMIFFFSFLLLLFFMIAYFIRDMDYDT